jgi:hypothetical protein
MKGSRRDRGKGVGRSSMAFNKLDFIMDEYG